MTIGDKLNNSLNSAMWSRAQWRLSHSVCNQLILRVTFANKGLLITRVLRERVSPLEEANQN